MWLSWLSIVLQTERLLVRFLVRAHVWVVGLVLSQGVCKRKPITISLSVSPPPFPLSKINKIKKLNNK